MKESFSIFEVLEAALFCGTARTLLAGNMTTPWPVVGSVVTHVAMVLAAWGDKRIHNFFGKEVKNMKIDLTQREVPPSGELPGVFADVVQTVKTDKRNKSYQVLVLVGELAAAKSNGKRFTASASFNLDDSRGINRLKETLKVWRGSDALPDLGDFDPETEFLGKGFIAEPAVEDKGGKRVIRLAGLKRGTGQPLTVSPDFVRAGQAPAAK